MSYPLVRECIAPGVYFSAITDKKFKHNRMSVNLIAKLDRQKVTGRAVVPFILRQAAKTVRTSPSSTSACATCTARRWGRAWINLASIRSSRWG